MTNSDLLSTSGTTSSEPGTAERDFKAIYETEWAWRVSELGHQAYFSAVSVDDFLPDVSEEAQIRRLHYWENVLNELSEIPREELNHTALVDYDVYVQQIFTLANQQRFRMCERPANADTSFWAVLSDRGNRALGNVDDAHKFLAQLADVPRYFQQQIENMRRGLNRGFAPPRVSMIGRDATINSVVDASSVEDLTLYKPFTMLPANVPEAVCSELQAQARKVLEDSVVPAFRELQSFVVKEYLPNLPTDIGATTLPDGVNFYKAQLEEFTTTDLSPQEIFDIGVEQVASIRREMEVVAEQTGFKDDVAGLLDFMRTDPQFYVTTPEAFLKEAAWQAKKFDAQVHRYFGRTPRMRFGIIEPAPDLAPFYTAGRGGVDRYTLNTYNLPSRPLYALPALTLHEAAPGHAFQIPFALEQTQHPDFRRYVYISAYAEGWGLYCERLGVEMGIYATPYEIMGMLSYQMWRAVRLVVDPGMHAFGWSRERAQDFLRENTAISDHEIVTEIDRYIAWPGQADAYFLGELKILELRERAEQALGQEFSIRNFHDAILELGSVPLVVLEQEIDRFIAAGGPSPFTD